MTAKPYRPGSGTEGAIFMAHYCEKCHRDAAFQISQEGDDEAKTKETDWRSN